MKIWYRSFPQRSSRLPDPDGFSKCTYSYAENNLDSHLCQTSQQQQQLEVADAVRRSLVLINIAIVI